MFLRLYLRSQRAKKLKKAGLGLMGAGLILAGVALAPLVPELQWHVGEARQALSRLPQQRVGRARAVGRLPENEDKVFVLTSRLQALELVGALHAASFTQPQVRALAQATQVKAAAAKPLTQVRGQPSFKNRIVIPKIKVSMPIVEGPDAASLWKGAWRIPDTSTPDRGGNTVLSGHRFRYLEGPLTFRHLDKLKTGDEVIVYWQGKSYHYIVDTSMVVPPTQVSILNNTRDPILTLFTCTPLFTSKNRLVQIAKLVRVESGVEAAAQ